MSKNEEEKGGEPTLTSSKRGWSAMMMLAGIFSLMAVITAIFEKSPAWEVCLSSAVLLQIVALGVEGDEEK